MPLVTQWPAMLPSFSISQVVIYELELPTLEEFHGAQELQ